jgi:predicted secreted Zn-dependent protease
MPSRRPSSTVILLLALLCGGFATACGQMQGVRALPPLPRGVRVVANETPYTVQGTSVEEIRRSLRETSREATRRNASGLHTWKLSYSYRYLQHDSYCEMTDVAIELRSEITVPNWVDREQADSTLAAQWETYITQLRGHEYTHREHSYRAAREMSRELLGLETPRCSGMRPNAQALANRILDKYRRLDEEFDAAEAGRIVWPPLAQPAGTRRPNSSSISAYHTRSLTR